ncbi:hypothetical protein ACLKMH_03750 [Psychromonas sp. KJ10-10]|uniref:hypothetical protein n=1 Tax=Psychromonas sp. KJ10-10 TaxID=3391823 RepID=UPI0039B6A4CF
MLQDHLAILPIITPILMGIVLLFARFSEYINVQRLIAICSQGVGLYFAIELLRTVILQGPIVYQLGNWQQPYGIALYVDQISALLVLLTCLVAFLLCFIVVLATIKKECFFIP